MDLIEHAAGVWARKVVVLAIAVTVAVLVLVWRSSAPDTYVADTTVQVRLPEAFVSDPQVQSTFYAYTVNGLAESRSVREAAIERAGTGQDVDEVGDDMSAEPNTQPGFVTVSASGETGEEAAALADALAAVLVDQVLAEQDGDLAAKRSAITDSIAEVARERREVAGTDTFALAALEREREALLASLRSATEETPWRIAVTEPASVPDAPESPNPPRDALLAFLIALVVAAEGVVVARAWRGTLSARRPEDDASGAAGVPGVLVGGGDGPTALAPLLSHVEPSRAVTLVQLGARAQARSATQLAQLLDARGDDVLLVDVTPARAAVHREAGVGLAPGLTGLGVNVEAATLAALPTTGDVSVLAAGEDTGGAGLSERLTRVLKTAPQSRVVVAASVARVDDLLGVSAALDGPTVVEVGADSTKAEVRDGVAALRGLGLDVVAVVVRRGSAGAKGRS